MFGTSTFGQTSQVQYIKHNLFRHILLECCYFGFHKIATLVRGMRNCYEMKEEKDTYGVCFYMVRIAHDSGIRLVNYDES